LCQKLVDNSSWTGLGEQKSLHLVTAGQAQQNPLVFGFNAFYQH
jgi:hypothetical protein